MKNKMILGNKGNGSLGDILWMTAVLRYIKDIKISLHADERSEWVAKVFENLCEVEHVDHPPERPDNIIDTTKEPYSSSHRSRKILLALGITDKVSVPLIKITEDEINWAKDFLRDYRNPVVIVNDNGGSGDKNNSSAFYRKPPSHIVQQFTNELIKKGFTPLQFGKSEDDKFTKLENCIPIRGLNLRQTAACYNVIGQYLGGDTGDYHLMLAAGGKTTVLIPDENLSLGYNYSDLLYKPENFENSISRVNYINFHRV
jgi:hypothetical protein